MSLTTFLVGCDGSEQTLPTSASTVAQRADSFVISGMVAESVDGTSRPLAEASVLLQIEKFPSHSSQTTGTDPNGRYTAQVPPGRVYVWAEGPAAVEQACVAAATIDKDTIMPDVELVPAGTSARLQSPPRPLIAGFVYERTPQGRDPLPGVQAILFQQNAQDHPVAQVETDDAGRFLLCRVNAPLALVVALHGYQPWSQVILGASDLDLQIELRR
jgi:hypothetical protein